MAKNKNLWVMLPWHKWKAQNGTGKAFHTFFHFSANTAHVCHKISDFFSNLTWNINNWVEIFLCLLVELHVSNEKFTEKCKIYRSEPFLTRVPLLMPTYTPSSIFLWPKRSRCHDPKWLNKTEKYAGFGKLTFDTKL